MPRMKILLPLLLLIGASPLTGRGAQYQANPIPPSWQILPIPRAADYGAADDFVTLGRVAIVRKEGGPYQTVRDEASELVRDSTITEEELVRILGEHGVADLDRLPDDRTSYADYSTLILLGSPQHNRQTARFFREMKLSFAAWDDPHTPEDDFTGWSDFGQEGYLLKVGRAGKQNIIVLAGYDFDDAKQRFHGAGTFYALQSFRQLIVADRPAVKIKTAEIADRPLLAVRGCMTGFDPRPEKQWRDIEFLPRIKANQNVYWYGNALGAYNSQSASKFRYPWTPEQLKLFSGFGKYCRERYVTMVFCMNPDHYHVEWAAAKTFDGSRKDPLHYDPDHQVEPEFRQMWAKLGYDVKNDIDILAAKFSQLHRVIPGVMFQMMNEDDGFGLFNEADQKLFNTKTGDARQDAINYGRARALFLTSLYRRIKELCPDSADVLPLCPPGQLPYQLVLERDEAYSREFLASLGATLKEQGLQEVMPVLTTGGGTAAEVITGEQLDRFRAWSDGCRVLLHDNNFPACSKVGAYEIDPKGPRSLHQINPNYPAGYRDRQLYKRLWGTHWNGVPDQVVLGWCQSQFMWNMLALDRQKVNALATRKVSSAESYPLVKSYLEEFDNPAAYLPDNQPPYRVKVISDRVTFPAEGWKYLIRYTDARRKECQRLRDKLGRLLPKLEAKWENPVEKRASLDQLGYSAYSFSSVYLAYGYIKGWENPNPEKPSPESPADRLEGAALRDLYLEADNFQELYFAGPDVVDGKKPINNHNYSGTINYIYTDGQPFTVPKTAAEAKTYTDIWEKGLQAVFFAPVSSTTPARLPDQDPCLATGWGAVEEANEEKFRLVKSKARLAINHQAPQRLLVRARIGTDATARSQSTHFSLATGDQRYRRVVCKPRWFNWLLPEGVDLTGVTLEADGPIRVYEVEIYREKDGSVFSSAAFDEERGEPLAAEPAGGATRLPNIVLIMADDLGYSDLGCYGGEIQTPNLDQLAAGGLRFSQFYNCALCGPSRAALMTGLHPHQVGIFGWTGLLNDRCVTVFELLKRAGYATCAVGRLDMITADNWHDPAMIRPYADRFLGSTGHTGPGNYFKNVRNTQFYRDGQPFALPPEGSYKTDLITDFAVAFIAEAASKEQPFFLYMAHYAPHWPLHAKAEDMAKYRELYRELGWDQARERRYRRLVELGLIGAGSRLSPRDARVPAWRDAQHKQWEADRMAAYAGQVDSLDQSVGRITEALQRAKVDTNTLVLFLSDNGASDQAVGTLDRPGRTWRVDGTPTRVGNKPAIPPGGADTFVTAGPAWSNVSNTPFRDHKQSNHEGGIATPCIAWWPAVIRQAGTISHQPGHITDIMATCLDVAGVKYPAEWKGRHVLPLAGASLLPVFKGRQSDGPRTLCWATSGCRAIRFGPWKLVAAKGGSWELYNLATDRTELDDLAQDDPDRVAAMAKAFAQWRRGEPGEEAKDQ